jgi:predicted Zn-dependent protease
VLKLERAGIDANRRTLPPEKDPVRSNLFLSARHGILMNMGRRLNLILLLAAFAAAVGCSVNPVTGKRELVFVSESSEIQMGAESYLPMQQSQGGEYDIDPALTEYVSGVGNRLAKVSDRQLPYEFVVLNNSVPNAWALPGGKIAVNRGLLTELNSEAELAAVLGHEIVHAAARHSAKRIERSALLQGAIVATAVVTSDSDYGSLAVGGAGVGAQLLNQSYGRGDELESDKYGMLYMSRAGYDPQGAVELQKAFVRLNDGKDADWLTGLFASHPPSQERVSENTRMAAALPPGGETGEDRFELAMGKTVAAKPAYDAYDEGREALADKKPDVAIEKAGNAIALLPEESHFYSLRGDARIVKKQHDMALTNFNSAIRRRDDFFYYYLQRGLTQEKLGHDDLAKADLEISIEMLPTAPAHYALGRIAARRGDKATAMEHYRLVASGGQGEVAQAASADLARLDITDNPSNYLLKRCDPDSSGNLVVSVKNNTSLQITGVSIVVQYTDNAGMQQRIDRNISGVIGPGKVASVNTGLGPYTAGSNCPATVISARVAE